MAATDSTQHRAAGRAKSAGARAGYLFLHSAVDGFSRLAYSEHLFDETAATAVGFWARARVWFAAHGITTIPRVATDNGSAYRSATFAAASSTAAGTSGPGRSAFSTTGRWRDTSGSSPRTCFTSTQRRYQRPALIELVRR